MLSRVALVVFLLIGLGQGGLPAASVDAQEVRDSTKRLAPIWRDSARYGGGPSVGAPPSDFTGVREPVAWCLRPTGRATGDFAVTGQRWLDASRGWLLQMLSDTTDWGSGWRKVLGGAPRLATTDADSIIQVLDEGECKEVAAILNRDVLGWQVGPPPVVIFRIHDHLIAYPSNARRGEWGLAVAMDRAHRIRAVATW